ERHLHLHLPVVLDELPPDLGVALRNEVHPLEQMEPGRLTERRRATCRQHPFEAGGRSQSDGAGCFEECSTRDRGGGSRAVRSLHGFLLTCEGRSGGEILGRGGPRVKRSRRW